MNFCLSLPFGLSKPCTITSYINLQFLFTLATFPAFLLLFLVSFLLLLLFFSFISTGLMQKQSAPVEMSMHGSACAPHDHQTTCCYQWGPGLQLGTVRSITATLPGSKLRALQKPCTHSVHKESPLYSCACTFAECSIWAEWIAACSVWGRRSI